MLLDQLPAVAPVSHELMSSTISLSWQTIASIVVPVVGGIGALFKWMMARVDSAHQSLVDDLKMRQAREEARTKTDIELAVALSKLSITQDAILRRMDGIACVAGEMLEREDAAQRKPRQGH